MSNTKELVEKALEEIRPFLNADGGDVALVSIKNNIATIALQGACKSCSVSQMTLKNGVEATIKKYAPHITEVVNISLP